MFWHKGQDLALKGDYPQAIKLMKKAAEEAMFNSPG
jgi:hypothetical protein